MGKEGERYIGRKGGRGGRIYVGMAQEGWKREGERKD